MKKYFALLVCCAVILSGCGGGGKSTTSVPMVTSPPVQVPHQQPEEPPQTPQQPTTPPQQPVEPPTQPQQPEQPVNELGPLTPVPEAFPNKIGDVGSMEIAFKRHGSHADLEKYFKDIVRYACAFAGRCIGDIVDRFDGAPIVKISGYATDEQKQKVQNAIQVVNQALPDGHKMILSSEIAPRATYLASTRVPEGEIYVGFDDPRYHAKLRESSTYVRYHLSNGSYGGAHIWTSSGNGFVPAFLRALGLRGSVSSVPSIFNPATHRNGVIIPSPYSSLTALDKQALKALYSHYDNGDNMLSDGPWNSSDFDFKARLTSGCVGYCGDIVGDLHFGVTYGNGSGRPWVNGPTPNTDVSRNSSLVPDPMFGEVRYKGGIVGVDSDQNLVFGDTIFDLELDTLEAVVLFHNLRARSLYNTNDFNIDKGRPWKRPHIGGYRVQITGNSFQNTSAGIEGRFFGPSHEYVGGTLQRSDLTAAFGARRPR